MEMMASAQREGRATHGGVRLGQVLCLVGCSVFAALYLEMFLETCAAFHTGVQAGFLYGAFTMAHVARTAKIFVLALVGTGIAFLLPRRVVRVVFRFRYLIAAVLFAGLVICEISFSSLGTWATQLTGGNGEGLLWGIPRGIRSDEFDVTTLFNFSQAHNGYQAWSTILTGDPTDTRLVYNLASWSPVTIFRPLFWGYLLFGSAKGISFFFCFKLFGAFFAAFECARVFTRDNRALSLAFALLITFSPVMQWWSYWEGLIYGQFLVALFYHFLHTRSTAVGVASGIAISWLCGCFLFLLYPAWMVPFFYVFAAMGLIVLVPFVIASRAAHRRFPTSRLVALGASLAVVVVLTAITFLSSSEALAAIGSTVYPGDRFSTGGGYGSHLFNYGNSLYFALSDPDVDLGSASELASTFSLFPMGLLLALYTFYKTREKPLLVLAVLQLVFVWYIVIGFPSFLSLITLFSYSPSFRVLFPAEYLEVVLMVMACSVWCRARRAAAPAPRHAALAVRTPRELSRRSVLALAAGIVVVSAVLTVVAQLALPGYDQPLLVAMLFLAIALMLTVVAALVTTGGARRWDRMFVIAALCVVGVSGSSVNPVQRGIAPVTDSAFAQLASQVVADDPDGVWMVEGPWYYANLCTAMGATTRGSSNMYPDMAFWHILDPDGAYDKYYNRYAHVNAYLTEEQEPAFAQPTQDSVSLGVPVDKLDDLGVTYLVSVNDRTAETMGDVSFELIGQGNNLYIYRVVYGASGA